MAYSYHNLGKLYADKHDYKQSEIFFKKAIDLRMKSLPPGSDLLKETKDDYHAFCTVTD
jgi:hypothetical protein